MGCKFHAKIKTLKFETKDVLLGIFRQKLGKKQLIFGIRTLEFAAMQKTVQNKNKQTNKKSNLGPKIPCLGILKCKFEKVLSYLKSASPNLSKCQK